MFEKLKSLLKRTPFYPLYKRLETKRDELVAIWTFWNWTPLDQERADFYGQFIKPGDLVYDVGANLGNRSKVFVKLGARVVAFEPQTSCYKFLTRVFAKTESVKVVKQALGRVPGVAELHIANASTISSLSPNWIEGMKASGRFASYFWGNPERVQVTTLDRAIQENGRPVFIKIDVEGFELEVISGLSTAVDCLSIEFTPEFVHDALRCVDRLSGISPVEARYSVGESMKWEIPAWLDPESFKRALLERTTSDPKTFGDAYIRRKSENDRP